MDPFMCVIYTVILPVVVPVVEAVVVPVVVPEGFSKFQIVVYT